MATGIDAETIRAARARAGGRADGRGLRPDRDDDPGVRHDGLVAGRRAQRDHGQPRPAGRRDVHARRRGRVEHARPERQRPRRHVRPLDLARARPWRDLRRAARGDAQRRDRDARRGTGPRAHHDRRQPRASRRRTPAGSMPRSTSLDFMVSVDIYVNETTRHADVILPSPSPRREAALRPRLLPASRCATSRTSRRR